MSRTLIHKRFLFLPLSLSARSPSLILQSFSFSISFFLSQCLSVCLSLFFSSLCFVQCPKTIFLWPFFMFIYFSFSSPVFLHHTHVPALLSVTHTYQHNHPHNSRQPSHKLTQVKTYIYICARRHVEGPKMRNHACISQTVYHLGVNRCNSSRARTRRG